MMIANSQILHQIECGKDLTSLLNDRMHLQNLMQHLFPPKCHQARGDRRKLGQGPYFASQYLFLVWPSLMRFVERFIDRDPTRLIATPSTQIGAMMRASGAALLPVAYTAALKKQGETILSYNNVLKGRKSGISAFLQGQSFDFVPAFSSKLDLIAARFPPSNLAVP